MRGVRDIGHLAKVSHWIASDVGWLVALAARGGSTSSLLDSEARLALGLEAYGEILRGGDEARIEAVLRLRLGVEKVVHHWDDDGHALHQCHVGGVGQDGQSRRGARLQVAVDLATL